MIYEPGDQDTAYAEARGAAAENGYNYLTGGTTVTPVDFNEDSTAVENANQLVVTVSHTAHGPQDGRPVCIAVQLGGCRVILYSKP